MILSLFDASGSIKKGFIKQGFECISLDIHPGYKGNKTDIQTNFLEWDYKAYSRAYFGFLFIALPCQTYSIASGAHHFKNNIPITKTAITSINILIRLFQVTQYFNCPYIIENPSGGLINNVFFKQFFNLNVHRCSLGSFGFPTQKKTDLFFNFDMLLLSNPTYRINNRYSKKSIGAMSYRQRVQYPELFVTWLTSQIAAHLYSSKTENI